MTDVILAFLADYWLSLLSVICLLVISAFFFRFGDRTDRGFALAHAHAGKQR